MPFCQLTSIDESCDSTIQERLIGIQSDDGFRATCSRKWSDFWTKCSERFGKSKANISTGSSHDVCCWARFQPNTANT